MSDKTYTVVNATLIFVIIVSLFTTALEVAK